MLDRAQKYFRRELSIRENSISSPRNCSSSLVRERLASMKSGSFKQETKFFKKAVADEEKYYD